MVAMASEGLAKTIAALGMTIEMVAMIIGRLGMTIETLGMTIERLHRSAAALRKINLVGAAEAAPFQGSPRSE
jgi:hypothetical protein